MSKLRFRVVETAFKKKPVAVAAPAERPSEYYAKYVFNKEKMFRYLPSKVYAKLIDVIDNGAPLDRSIADEVAAGMKKWALEMAETIVVLSQQYHIAHQSPGTYAKVSGKEIGRASCRERV